MQPPRSPAALLTAALLALTACGPQAGTNPPPPPDAGPRQSEPSPIPDQPDSTHSAAELAAGLSKLGFDVNLGQANHPSLASIEGDTPDGGHLIGVGVFIDPVTLAIPYQIADAAESLRLDLGNCEQAEIRGIVGIDQSLQIALLELEAPPVGVEPVAISPLPTPGEPLGITGVLTLVRPDCGYAAVSCADCNDCVDVRTLHGWGDTIIIDIPFGRFAYGSPVYASDGACAGLLLGPAGGGTSFVFPAARITEIQRHEPIPIAEFSTRDRAGPELTSLHRFAGQRQRLDGDIPKARAEFRAAVAETPDDWKSVYGLGVCEDMLGNRAGAETLLQQSIDIEPLYAESHYSLGIVRASAGKMGTAIAPLREAARLDPEYASAHAMLALALYQSGQVDEGLRIAETSLDLTDVQPEHFSNLCLLYEEQDRPADAERVALRWTEHRKSSPAAWHALGKFRWKQQHYEDAIAPLRKALELGGQGPGTHHYLAISLGMLGREQEAIAAVKAGLEKYPEDQLLNRILRSDLAEPRPGG